MVLLEGESLFDGLGEDLLQGRAAGAAQLQRVGRHLHCERARWVPRPGWNIDVHCHQAVRVVDDHAFGSFFISQDKGLIICILRR